MPDDKPTIWVTPMLFKKTGFPSVGQFWRTIQSVVILRLDTWQRLCTEIPDLGARAFNVGTED